jgi:hypothetical protein
MAEFMTLPLPLQLLLGLCMLLFSLGAGHGSGRLAKLLGSGSSQKTEQKVEVKVNESSGPETGKCAIDPKNCPAHEEEKNRSLENRQKIGEIFTCLDDMRTDLGDMKGDIGEVKGMVSVLVQQSSKK